MKRTHASTHSHSLLGARAAVWLAGAVLAWPGVACAAAQKGAVGAAIVFPAKGMLDPDQGTVEAVFSLGYSFGDQMIPENQSSVWLLPVVWICDSKGVPYTIRKAKQKTDAKRGSKVSHDKQGLWFHVGLYQHSGVDVFSIGSIRFERPVPFEEPRRQVLLAVGPGGKPSLKEGEWHTLAATWQLTGTNYALNLYLDGKSVKTQAMPVSPTMGGVNIDEKDLLCIGYPGRVRGTLQSVRVSKRARSAEEIAAADKAGLVKDDATTLLLTGDTVFKMKADRFEDLVNKEGRTLRIPPEGMVFGKLEPVSGRDGKAFRFPK